MNRLAILIIAAALLVGCAAPGQPPTEGDKALEDVATFLGLTLPALLLH